ncbi:MAG: DUF1640 domain-containing protein [Magnetococcales bacterium]|nr:DUF1640 domain-containing protein [Magnetococcales bacterium]
MMTTTFDTLKFANRLNAAGMDSRQAEAQSETMEVNLKDLVTREYLNARLDAKLAESKTEIIKWMFGVAAGQAMFIIAILKLFPSH